jgi:predicted permease
MFNIAAVWPMARYSNKPIWGELIRNPLILATICGLSANLLHIRLAVWLDPTFSRIGAATIALGLMAAGAGLQLKALHQAKVLSVALLSIKHFMLPIVAVVIAQFFQLNLAQTTTLLAFSALPTASSSYVLAAKMGYDATIVAGMVTLSTLLGMVSLTFALGFLLPI